MWRHLVPMVLVVFSRGGAENPGWHEQPAGLAEHPEKTIVARTGNSGIYTAETHFAEPAAGSPVRCGAALRPVAAQACGAAHARTVQARLLQACAATLLFCHGAPVSAAPPSAAEMLPRSTAQLERMLPRALLEGATGTGEAARSDTADNTSVWLADTAAATAPAGRFTPLEQLVAAAAWTHPLIDARRADVAGARADVDAARWQYFPQPSLQTDYTEGDNATVFRLQQPLWAGGRLDADYDFALAGSGTAERTLEETQFDMALRVVDGAQNLLLARGRRGVAQTTVQRLAALSEMIARRHERGASALTDRSLADSRLVQALADMEAAAAGERIALAQLSQLVGRGLGAEELDSLDLDAQLELDPPERLIARARGRHPMLRRVAAELEQAQAQVAQRRAALWPTLGLRYEYQHGSYPGSAAAGSRVFTTLQYAPGAGFSSLAGIRAAEAKLDGARRNVEAATREVSDRFRVEWESFASARTRIGQLRAGRDHSEAILGSYQRAYVAGRRSWLDLMNAVRELAQSEQALADARVQRLLAAYRVRLHDQGLSQTDRHD